MLHSRVYFVSITVRDLIIVHVDWLSIDLFAGVQCHFVLSVLSECVWIVLRGGWFWANRKTLKFGCG